MRHASEESPRMFESDFIDFFSRVPWWAVPLIYVPAIAGFAYSASHVGVSATAIAGQFAAGVFAWTLMEYWLHRTLFHWTPATSWGPRFHFLLHGVHHTWHRDRFRLVMPPAASIAIGVVVYGSLWTLSMVLAPLVTPTWTLALFAGVMAGYMTYDLTHYYLHHGKPVTWVGRKLRAHHMAHHHNAAHKDRKFGVSNTLWDHVFGTY